MVEREDGGELLIVPDVDQLHSEIFDRLVGGCDVCGGTGRIVVEADDPMKSRRKACGCLREVRFRCSLLTGNVPREFWTVENLVFEWNIEAREKVGAYCDEIVTARIEGNGLVLLGENGSGKSACACLALCAAARRGWSVGYITAREFVTSSILVDRDPELKTWRDGLLRADFLVVDEMGKEYRKDGSEFAQTEMDGLLRWRRGDFRPTVVTSNLKLKELEDVYGASLWSIISDRMEILQFQPGDFRAELRRRKKKRGRIGGR